MQITTLGVYLASVYGLVLTGGHHIIYLSMDTLTRALRLTYIISLFISYPNVLVKISIVQSCCCGSRPRKTWRIGLYVLLCQFGSGRYHVYGCKPGYVPAHIGLLEPD